MATGAQLSPQPSALPPAELIPVLGIAPAATLGGIVSLIELALLLSRRERLGDILAKTTVLKVR